MQEDQTFTNLDFAVNPVAAEYEACTFVACNFAGVDISGLRFVDCRFTDCDWSNAKLQKTTLNDVRFLRCKLLGLHFEDCSEFLFAVSFEECTLNFSSFYKRPLKKTVFKNCSLQEVDFTDANLAGASFNGCDLHKALFENTVLEKADFRGAVNFSVDPERNAVKKARFGRESLHGLLHKYDLDVR